MMSSYLFCIRKLISNQIINKIILFLMSNSEKTCKNGSKNNQKMSQNGHKFDNIQHYKTLIKIFVLYAKQTSWPDSIEFRY